jgi:hypothetical protein
MGQDILLERPDPQEVDHPAASLTRITVCRRSLANRTETTKAQKDSLLDRSLTKAQSRTSVPQQVGSGYKMKPSTIAAALLAAALSLGSASAQVPIGQAPIYSPPSTPLQAPVWSAPVTGHPAPYIPPPQSTYVPNPVYSPPVTGTVNPYPARHQ